MVKFALSLGPADYFALMVLAFVTVSAAFGDSALRGLTSLFLGLTLGLVGIDLQTGQARLTFGIPDLLDGIEVTTLAVALFAIGEALKIAATPVEGEEKVEAVKGSVWMTQADWARSWKPWLRGTAHRLPDRRHAGGRRRDRHLPLLLDREGADRSTPRSSATAPSRASPAPRPPTTPPPPARWCRSSPSACRPSATAAIMLAGFQQFGLQPGPLLFVNNASLVWSLIASLLVANFMLIVLNLPLVGLWVRLLTIPKPWLYAGILTFATLGTIGANPSTVELGLLLAFGLLGYGLRVFGYPIAPGGRRPHPRPARRAAAPPGAGDQPGRPVGPRPLAGGDHPLPHRATALTPARFLRLRGKGQGAGAARLADED